jgi:hypothetical protein
MEVACYVEQYPYQIIWCRCGGTQFQCFLDLKCGHEMEGGRVWNGRVVLGVLYPIPHSPEI